MLNNLITIAETAAPAITSDMLAPLQESVFSNIGVILPAGIAIFGVIIGIGLLPKVIKKFF